MTNYWSHKRVVLTGGGGFLGTHVRAALADAGCPYVFSVRSMDYDLTREECVTKLFCDLADGKDGWPSARNGRNSPVDVVIHLAGLVGGIGANKQRPADFFYQNLMMGTLILHHAWRSGAEKLIAAGAGCGYPELAPLPLQETCFWDGFPQQESAPYSLAKRLLQVQAEAYWRQHRFPCIIGVPGNVYGPHDNFDLADAHVIPALVRKFVEDESIVVWGSGKPRRDFVFAADVADGLLRAGELFNTAEVVNLSSGMDYSIREVVAMLANITGFKGTLSWDATRPDGQARRVFDVSKAKRELRFRARTGLYEGLVRTVDWYRSNAHTARRTVAHKGSI